SHREPLLIAAVVLLDYNRVAPGSAPIGRLVGLNGESVRGVQTQTGEIEIAVPVDVKGRVARGDSGSGHRRNESGGPCLAAVIRDGEAREKTMRERDRRWVYLY